MLEKLNHSHWKIYAATWMICLYSGALIQQFAIKDSQMGLAVWGLLFAAAVVITSTSINWTSVGDENIHLQILTFLMLSFGVGLVVTLANLTFIPPKYSDYLLLWSIGSLILYFGMYFKTRRMNVVFSIFLILISTGAMIFLPNLTIPVLGTMSALTPLLFGFVQSVAILILLI